MTSSTTYSTPLIPTGDGVCRKQKEIMKALETPEEKRLRRLAKKEAKELKKRQKEGWHKESLVSDSVS